MSLVSLPIESPETGERIGLFLASTGGCISLRSGRMALAPTLTEWIELHRQLGNAIQIANGAVKLEEVWA